jgi:diaminopimelate decarboxylase
MTRAHPAGPRHADVIPQHEDGGSPPEGTTLDALPPAVWPRHALRGDDGVVRLAGIDVATLA